MEMILKKHNKIICLVLIVCICLTLVLIPYTDCYAFAAVIPVAVSALATYILAASGLTLSASADGSIYSVGNEFVTWADQQKESQALGQAFVMTTLLSISQSLDFSKENASFKIPVEIYDLAKNYISTNYPDLIDGTNYTFVNPILDVATFPVPIGKTSISFHFSDSVASSTSLPYPSYLCFNSSDSITINDRLGNGYSLNLTEGIIANTTIVRMQYTSLNTGSVGYQNVPSGHSGTNATTVRNGTRIMDFADVPWFIAKFTYNDVVYLLPVWGAKNLMNPNIGNVISSNYKAGDIVFCGSTTFVTNIGSDAISIGGSDVLGGDESWKEEGHASPFPFPVTGVDTGTDVISIGIPKTDEGLQDIIVDGISIPNVGDITYTDVIPKVDVSEGDETTEKDKTNIGNMEVPATFLNKFPFCIPFDIARTFEMLVAPPVTPKWDIPFVMDSVSVDEVITIDFAKFNVVATISRWFLSALFILLLIIGTRKLIKG